MLAVAVRVVGLDAWGLWHDEALEVGRAAAPWAVLLTGRAIDQDPPLLAVLYRGWTAWGGGDGWLRLPSVLLGAAAAAVLGAWAVRRFGGRVGAAAGLGMAVGPAMVHYGQEVNQYAAMLFLAVVGWVAWDGVATRGRAVDWRRWTVAACAGLATHYGMVFPLAAMSGWLAWRALRLPRGRTGRGEVDVRALARHMAACGATVGVLMGLGLAERVTVPHLQGRFGGTHAVKEADYLVDVVWRQVLVFLALPFGGGPALMGVWALALVAGVGAVSLWRAGGAGRRAVVAGVGALALVYPFDGLGWYPLGQRWGLFAAPPACLALAAGVERLGRGTRGLWALLIGGLVVNAVMFWPQADAWNPWLAVPREDVRGVVSDLAAVWRPGDRVWVYPAAWPVFDHYWEGRPAAVLRRDDATRWWAGDAAVDAPCGAQAGARWMVLSRVEGEDEAVLVREVERGGWRVVERIDRVGAALLRLTCEPPPSSDRNRGVEHHSTPPPAAHEPVSASGPHPPTPSPKTAGGGGASRGSGGCLVGCRGPMSLSQHWERGRLSAAQPG